MADNSREYARGNAGGCLAKDVNKEIRKDEEVDIGADYTTDKKLMRPQTGDEVDG